MLIQLRVAALHRIRCKLVQSWSASHQCSKPLLPSEMKHAFSGDGTCNALRLAENTCDTSKGLHGCRTDAGQSLDVFDASKAANLRRASVVNHRLPAKHKSDDE